MAESQTLKTFQWSLDCAQIFWQLPDDRKALGLYGIKEIIERLYGEASGIPLMNFAELPYRATLYFNLTEERSELDAQHDAHVVLELQESGVLFLADLESVLHDLKRRGILSAHRYILFIGCTP